MLARDADLTPLGSAAVDTNTPFPANATLVPLSFAPDSQPGPSRPTRVRFRLEPWKGSGHRLIASSAKAVVSRGMPSHCLLEDAAATGTAAAATITTATVPAGGGVLTGAVSKAAAGQARLLQAVAGLQQTPISAQSSAGAEGGALAVELSLPEEVFHCHRGVESEGPFYRAVMVQLELRVLGPNGERQPLSVGSSLHTLEGGCAFFTLMAACNPEACEAQGPGGGGMQLPAAAVAAAAALHVSLERALGGRPLPRAATGAAAAACAVLTFWALIILPVVSVLRRIRDPGNAPIPDSTAIRIENAIAPRRRSSSASLSAASASRPRSHSHRAPRSLSSPAAAGAASAASGTAAYAAGCAAAMAAASGDVGAAGGTAGPGQATGQAWHRP
ncbi:hypothetical protein HYH03_013042 [Edaphochlamys debaryana]|uniref:Uncharacterized protein n=1 Tax=Edaphochlamys debaryana TaxID=47281 RepID=A0A836BTR3_9CHLO|nr:hypothetical protein HYH03_013042 [Edaphochlamys debaryana]|eukprot:KAG2488352.1 hypothetical protein HYH03_013042 [Edaphochlamys debaryana]